MEKKSDARILFDNYIAWKHAETPEEKMKYSKIIWETEHIDIEKIYEMIIEEYGE